MKEEEEGESIATGTRAAKNGRGEAAAGTRQRGEAGR